MNAPHILVVEDYPMYRSLLQLILQRVGYRVSLASDAFDALEALKLETPDLVLCDVQMPLVSGTELVRVLRAHPQWATVQWVMLSHHLAPEVRREALESGADDFLCKPINHRDLTRTLCKRLERRATLPQPSPSTPKPAPYPSSLEYLDRVAVDFEARLLHGPCPLRG